MSLTKRSKMEPQDDATKPEINVYCPKLKCKGSVSVLTCLFRCPKATVIKCEAYTSIYPYLLTFEIDPKYITKYGEVTVPVPLVLRKRRKRRAVDK